MKWKIVLAGCSILIAAFYYIFFLNNIHPEVYHLKLKERASMESILDSLEKNKVLKSKLSFDLARNFIKIKTVPSGYYIIKSGIGNKTLIQKLKRGNQDPIIFTLSTATFITEIAGRVGKKMSFDSASFMNFIYADSNQMKYGYSAENALCIFLPNTHQIFWNSSIEGFVSKFYRDYKQFWNEVRLAEAKNIGLQPNEVYILASLIQKEYNKNEEKSIIAAVLLNRLNRSMPLQVDATCKYATGDFAAKRVLNYHTSFPSPFNTYLHYGLPPGPICVPETSTIEAVLHPKKNDFLFYCADPNLSGYHIFSKTLSEHEAVANEYRRKMDAIGIR